MSDQSFNGLPAGEPNLGAALVVATFRRWLHLPDPVPLLATLGTVAANRLKGDPVWLLLVGPPGCGKSELLQSLTALPDVHPTSTLTEAALLSGTPRKDHARRASGGLLKGIGDFGLLALKDFGSILSMHREQRAQVLAALREIYDGSWTRYLGTDGGKTLSWSGKLGLLAGCTPTIDRHHAVMGAMGERFVLVRLAETDADEQARRALAHAGREKEMRAELTEAVAALFTQPAPPEPKLDEVEDEYLVSLATFVVRCRSAVERDSYSREIELVPDPEAPTRLIVVLRRLLAGLHVIGVERHDAWQVVMRAGLDSIPALRRAVIDALAAGDGLFQMGEIVSAVGHPKQTTRRALEDLAAHSIAEQVGEGRDAAWCLSGLGRARYAAAVTVPEKSSSMRRGRVKEGSDISGTAR